MFQQGIFLLAETARFCQYNRYVSDTAGIFSSTKQWVYLYWCTDRYDIYQLVQYEIGFTDSSRT